MNITVKKMWPILKFGKRKVNNKVDNKSATARDTQEIDRLSELPDDILVSILSSLTMKEAARTSVLSHRWTDLCRYHPVLEFEETIPAEKAFEQKKSDFASRVNQVVEGHLGGVIDELRVSFDLDNSYKSQIDKWVVSALQKKVKRLVLNLPPRYSNVRIGCDNYTLTPECCMLHNVASFKNPLTSLCLDGVDVSAELIECFLCSCPFLENLSIAYSSCLTSIRASGFSLQLKHLKVSDCNSIEVIDISAPKLLSFVYFGNPVSLHIRNASLLSKVSIGARAPLEIAPVFDSLSEYFPQLESLALDMCIHDEMNMEPILVPQLTNLKHLELRVGGSCGQTLLGWTSLIEASPRLEKVTLELFAYSSASSIPVVSRRVGQPLRCLKTLELLGFMGMKIDLEFATYVLQNAIMLQEVLVDFTPGFKDNHIYKQARRRLKYLKKQIPRGVNLILEHD